MQKIGKNRLLLFFLPFSLCGVHAQSSLKGKVESSFSDVEGVHVINRSFEFATITDAGGYFDIPAREGDTILFSAVQFRKTEIAVTADMLNTSPLTIHLREAVTELDEVVLKNLTGNLTTDLRKIKTDSVNAMSLGFPNAHVQPLSQPERRLKEATTGGGLIPLNPLINAITGRTKRLKKYVLLEKQEAKLEKIYTSFGSTFFISSGIPEEKIYDFLFFCSVQPQYDPIVKSDDQAALAEFLEAQAVRYKKINDPEPPQKD